MGFATGSLMGLATLTLGWLGYTATQQPTAPAQAPSLDKHVTASLTNASMDDVLQWLRKTGVNFVIEKNDANAKAKFNINVVNKPLKDVMDAIASAAGCRWQKHGDVYSLSRGMAFAPEMLGDWEHDIAPMIEEGDMQRNELFNSITPKQKELMKSRGHLMPEDLTSRQKELLKPFGDLKKSIGIKDGDREFNLGPQGNAPSPRVRVMPPPAMPRIEAVPMPETSRWKELSASLTAEQKDLLKSQGHLFDDQLTPAQLRLVNLPNDATFTLTIVNGANSITIKSRKQ